MNPQSRGRSVLWGFWRWCGGGAGDNSEGVGESSSVGGLLLNEFLLHSLPVVQQAVPLLTKVVDLLVPRL